LAIGSRFCTILLRNQCRKHWEASLRRCVIRRVRPEPNGLRVFRTGSPSFAQNTVSAFFLVFFVFMAIFGHVEVAGGRLEGPHAVGHGGTRGEPREVRGWG